MTAVHPCDVERRAVGAYSLIAATGRLTAKEFRLTSEIFDAEEHYIDVRRTWFDGIGEAGLEHIVKAIGGGRRKDPDFTWTNTGLGNVKSAIANIHRVIWEPSVGATIAASTSKKTSAALRAPPQRSRLSHTRRSSQSARCQRIHRGNQNAKCNYGFAKTLRRTCHWPCLSTTPVG